MGHVSQVWAPSSTRILDPSRNYENEKKLKSEQFPFRIPVSTPKRCMRQIDPGIPSNQNSEGIPSIIGTGEVAWWIFSPLRVCSWVMWQPNELYSTVLDGYMIYSPLGVFGIRLQQPIQAIINLSRLGASLIVANLPAVLMLMVQASMV